MIQKTRSFRSLLLATLLCGTATASLLAQGPDGPLPGGPGGPGSHGGPRGHHGPPPSPIFEALDANHDGILSTDEINNAPTILKGLLRPGSNELRREDVRPAPALRGSRSEDGDEPSPDRAERIHRRPMGQPHNQPPRPEDRHADAPDKDRPAPADAPRPHGPDADEADKADKGPRGPHHGGPRPNPVFDTLDTDGNGILSSEELSRSADTLKGLLKEGATQLRREDMRPAHPPLPPQPAPQQ